MARLALVQRGSVLVMAPLAQDLRGSLRRVAPLTLVLSGSVLMVAPLALVQRGSVLALLPPDYRKSKDQLSQQRLISIALNVLFIFSGGLFLFFGMDWDNQFIGNLRWYILLSSIAVIALVYFFKNIFFRILGYY